MTPVIKKVRKSGRGGRGKSRGGARNSSRNSMSSPSLSGVKRERSPSLEPFKPSGRGKLAKLASARRSQESPRSLRSRNAQNQSFPSSADEAPASANNQLRTSKRKTENDEADLSHTSIGSPNAESLKTRSLTPSSAPTVHKLPENATSNEVANSSGKRIPRLIDVSLTNRREALNGVTPLDWTSLDVAQFLRVNDCAAYCDTFSKAVSIISIPPYSNYVIKAKSMFSKL